MNAAVEIISKHDGATVGWGCRGCGVLYRLDFPDCKERAARCCHTPPCPGCGGKMDKHYLMCSSCASMVRLKSFQNKPEVPWDGEFPIAVFDDDKYFFDIDEVAYWIDDLEEGTVFEFEACKEVQPRSFDVEEFLYDDLPEDGDIPGGPEFSETVNAWIKANCPKLYLGNSDRITSQVLAALQPKEQS